MGYSRNEQNTDMAGDFDTTDASGRYGYGARQGNASSARRYAAAGYFDDDRSRSYGRDRDSMNADRDRVRDGGNRAIGTDWGDRAPSRDDGYAPYGQRGDYDAGGYGDRSFDAGPRYRQDEPSRGAAGYDRDERGFMSRAGDEVRSWFGDDDAAYRRELDHRFDASNDADYYSWRRSQIDALDRDYAEYRRENQARFHSEFDNWRTDRNGQRTSLSKVSEHMEVVGSDGVHVGTVDKVRGDRIILTKNDANADGKHHSIPSRWIETVDDKVTIRKTAQAAMDHWRDEDRASDGDTRSRSFGAGYSARY